MRIWTMGDAPTEDPHGHSHDEPAGPTASPPTNLELLFEFASPAWAARLRSALEPLPPARLGPYEGLVEIGRGGQGEVYRANQPGTGRFVALKRIAGLGFSPRPSLVARFNREVEALTRLSHPNVVSVFSLEVIDGHSLLVMEYIDGQPIDRWADLQWAQGAEPRNAVLRVFAAVCDGVAHAHQRGVLHRDLKPSNILVNGDGQPKVLDFGIARVLAEQATAGAEQAWTVTGFAGTPAYASPEQLRPGAEGRGGIDTRSDVYSLGVLLYRVLAGQEAFDARGGIADLMMLVERGPVPGPSMVRHGLPAECNWIVRKATDPDPARRYQTAESLAEDVRRLIDGRPVLAHPPSAWYTLRRAIGRRPWLSAGLAAAVSAIMALGTVSAVQAARLSARSRDLEAALETANREKERAEREEQRHAVMSERLLSAHAAVSPTNHETYFHSRENSPLRTFERLVESLTVDDSDNLQAELRMRLGFLYFNARRYADAERMLAAAQEYSERIDDPASMRAIWIVLERGRSLHHLARNEDRLALVERAMKRAKSSTPTFYSAMLHWSRTFAMDVLKRPATEVVDAATQMVEQMDAHPDRPSERSRAREEAAVVVRRLGEAELGERWVREALEISMQGGVEAGSKSRFQAFLASILMTQGKWDQAEPLLRETVAYRLRREGADGSRAHRFLRRHAEVLQRLGRFDEAANRWELSMVRPLSESTPNPQTIAHLRFGLAAARFGMGEASGARVALAQAISLGRTTNVDDPQIRALADAAEQALRASGWQLDESVKPALGDMAWLVGTPVSISQPARDTQEETE